MWNPKIIRLSSSADCVYPTFERWNPYMVKLSGFVTHSEEGEFSAQEKAAVIDWIATEADVKLGSLSWRDFEGKVSFLLVGNDWNDFESNHKWFGQYVVRDTLTVRFSGRGFNTALSEEHQLKGDCGSSGLADDWHPRNETFWAD